jgi:hypothetical protein
MPDNIPDLTISAEKVCYIVAKAREFDVKDVVTDPDDASNATDDGMVSVRRITRTIRWCRKFPRRSSA